VEQPSLRQQEVIWVSLYQISFQPSLANIAFHFADLGNVMTFTNWRGQAIRLELSSIVH
jgi:hypothetical protein